MSLNETKKISYSQISPSIVEATTLRSIIQNVNRSALFKCLAKTEALKNEANVDRVVVKTVNKKRVESQENDPQQPATPPAKKLKRELRSAKKSTSTLQIKNVVSLAETIKS